MDSLEQYLASDEIDPIDLVETLAHHNSWDFDRVAENQIAMTIEGQWHTYSLSLAWSGYDETLRLVCTFELDPPEDRRGVLLETLDGANDRLWCGSFTTWPDQKMIVFRYGLNLAGGAGATGWQIDDMIAAAVGACERFYPAFQLSARGDATAAEALGIAISEAYGRA
ncbi:MAG: YbjN domain-containing protein [Pseudomonadota bacterium]